MRDRIKNTDYWREREQLTTSLLQRRYEKLRNGEIMLDRVNIVKQDMVDTCVRIILIKYSAGYQIIDLHKYLIDAISLTYESWNGFQKLKYEGKVLNQYVLNAYDQMLWMLSLGSLLDIDEAIFKKLVDVIDRDQVRDNLFEFIIRTKIKSRQSIKEESYEYGWMLYSELRQAITESDKTIAEKLVNEFVTNKWYKEHKECGWYDSHVKNNDTYFGYWSFETAAIVKIMGLDDSSFIDCQYYPKDLVHL